MQSTQRLLKRAIPTITAGLNTLVAPLLTPLVSVAVVRLVSPVLWGQFVQIMIVIQLASHIATWGGRDYLVRAFSQAPAQIARQWQLALIARLVLLLICMLPLCLLGWPAVTLAAALFWLFGMLFVQVYDSLITYTKSFGYAALLEIVGTLLLSGLVLFFKTNLTLTLFIYLNAAIALIKAGALFFHFRRWMHVCMGVDWPESWGFVQKAFPFFLLGLSGMLQSRADLYSASLLLTTIDLAHYQILGTLVGYLQALPNLILIPLIRALYRLSPAATPRLAIRMILAGIIAIPPLVGIGGWLIGRIYHFELPILALFGAALAALPICWYLPQIYALYRVGQQQRVLFINIIGILASLASSLLLIPPFGIAGGVLAAAIGQWLMLIIYFCYTQ